MYRKIDNDNFKKGTPIAWSAQRSAVGRVNGQLVPRLLIGQQSANELGQSVVSKTLKGRAEVCRLVSGQ